MIVDGSMKIDKRQKAIYEMQSNEECMVMLVSLKSGNVGLNLTFASHVILMDLWYFSSHNKIGGTQVYFYCI
jgi:SNF2 family DNA or RNA helicase